MAMLPSVYICLYTVGWESWSQKEACVHLCRPFFSCYGEPHLQWYCQTLQFSIQELTSRTCIDFFGIYNSGIIKPFVNYINLLFSCFFPLHGWVFGITRLPGAVKQKWICDLDWGLSGNSRCSDHTLLLISIATTLLVFATAPVCPPRQLAH